MKAKITVTVYGEDSTVDCEMFFLVQDVEISHATDAELTPCGDPLPSSCFHRNGQISISGYCPGLDDRRP